MPIDLKNVLFIFMLIVCYVYSFQIIHKKLYYSRSNKAISMSNQINHLKHVNVYKSAEDVGIALCNDFINEANLAIQSKGSFYVAVPGGSVLKLLSTLKSNKSLIDDWSKVYLFYVNHKCVIDTDPSATHKKAKSLFLDDLTDINVFPLQSNPIESNEVVDADRYSSILASTLPKVNNMPQFDYMLLGVGKDGHIGSLYADRNEVLIEDKFVAAVNKKSPSSVTLTLPVMNNAKSIRVVMMGEDKAIALEQAVLKSKTPIEFPICGIRNEVWLVDSASASVLYSNGFTCNSH